MNHLIYSGNLTADIENRQAGDHNVSKFTVAINQGERTTFLPTEAWDMPHLERYLHKGSKVLVRGSLKQENWETKEGEKRSRLIGTAYEVEFLDRPADGAESSSQRSVPSTHSDRRPRNRGSSGSQGSSRRVREEPAAYGATG